MLAFPSILLAIAVVAALGPSLRNALIAIAIINIPNFGRLVRSRVLSVKQEEYVMAAKAIGMKGYPESFQSSERMHVPHKMSACNGDMQAKGS